MAASPEKNIGRPQSVEAAPATVSQPVKIESHMGAQLDSFIENINRISENSSGSAGEQWSGSSGAVVTKGSATPATSARDHAIANIPAPAAMQRELERHIRTEVKNLRKQAQSVAKLNRPGAAFRLNELYKKIRSLNALLAELLGASADALKKLFIRVFIDRQAIL